MVCNEGIWPDPKTGKMDCFYSVKSGNHFHGDCFWCQECNERIDKEANILPIKGGQMMFCEKCVGNKMCRFCKQKVEDKGVHDCGNELIGGRYCAAAGGRDEVFCGECGDKRRNEYGKRIES